MLKIYGAIRKEMSLGSIFFISSQGRVEKVSQLRNVMGSKKL